MNFYNSIFIICLHFVLSKAYDDDLVSKILEILKQRYALRTGPMGAPNEPEELPESESILPGHTLIRPTVNMLQSAAKYPRTGRNTAVYGNTDNLGIIAGKTPYRVMYSGFRRSNADTEINRSNNDMTSFLIQQAIRNIARSNGNKKNTDVVILEITPGSNIVKSDYYRHVSKSAEEILDENDGHEELDITSSEEEEDFRRRRGKTKRHRDRDRYYPQDNTTSEIDGTTTSDDTDSDSTDYEKNPGNPFTLFKGKYKQNWMWNHFMDGDHMNINPFGPTLQSNTPSGHDLFFNRKWWYFNQDDYRPLR